jgi:integrase
MKKPMGLKTRGSKYYCRIQNWNTGKDILVPLQTESKLVAFQRCTQVNVYRKFIANGEMTIQELTNNCTEIAEWFNHSKSKVVPITISELSNQWLKIKSVELAKKTIIENRRNIQSVIDVIGDKNVKELTIEDIDRFKIVSKGKKADVSINRELVIFKAFTRWLYDRKYIDRALKIKLIKIHSEPRPKYITERDFTRLMVESSMPQWIKDACKVYWFTGCRKMELIEGKLVGNRLVIDSEISKSGREFSCTIPTRFIPIVKDIHKRRDEYTKTMKLKSFGYYVSKQVIAGYKEIGIYEINRTKLHSLRHSYGCRMYLITADIKEVGKMMNHKDRTSTEQYVGYTQDLLEDFPSDAEHSAFKNNMDRVKQANKDILKYLINPKIDDKGQDYRDKIQSLVG